jgi:hypothetical protein
MCVYASVPWLCAKTNQSLKGCHRLLTAIVPEDELVEVDLELVLADAMIGSDQPLLEVADCSVSERYDRFGALPQAPGEG